MSSAKAALESDTRVSHIFFFYFDLFYFHFISFSFSNVSDSKHNMYQLLGLIQVLAFEAGRKHKIRVNTISAGIVSPLY
jgi:hypothetical protein